MPSAPEPFAHARVPSSRLPGPRGERASLFQTRSPLVTGLRELELSKAAMAALLTAKRTTAEIRAPWCRTLERDPAPTEIRAPGCRALHRQTLPHLRSGPPGAGPCTDRPCPELSVQTHRGRGDSPRFILGGFAPGHTGSRAEQGIDPRSPGAQRGPHEATEERMQRPVVEASVGLGRGCPTQLAAPGPWRSRWGWCPRSQGPAVPRMGPALQCLARVPSLAARGRRSRWWMTPTRSGGG